MDLEKLIASGVRKPARYAGNEFFPTGYVGPAAGDVRCVLAYPDLYEIGMSNTGMRILYSVLRRMPGVYADLAFCPWPDMEELLRSTGDQLRSRHGAIPLADFDVIGFSLQYELNYSNVLCMLDLAGIPLRSAERSDSHPLVIAGGPCASHPEPVAPFIDAFVIGDGEDALPEVVRLVQESRSRRTHRSDLLHCLSALPGVYVPANAPESERVLPHVVRKRDVLDLDKYLPFSAFPVPAVETVFDRLSLELARGCWQGCRFCEAGFTYRPPRERNPEALLAWAEETLEATGIEEIAMASLSTADYSSIVPLFTRVREMAKRRQVTVSVSSLRAYGVAPGVLDVLSRSRPSSLTLAPEAGTQRLRDVLNKNVTEQQILVAVSSTAERGFNRLKLYFMIGVPTETQEDLDGIRDLSVRCHDILRSRFGRKAELVASVSLFVPRPHTPFQWQAMLSRPAMEERVAYLRRIFPARKGSLGLKWHSPAMSFLEAVLTRGDRSLADVIEAAYRSHARFDGWDECFKETAWNAAFQSSGLDASQFLAQADRSTPLPWSHVTTGVDEDFLWREGLRGIEGKTTRPCQPLIPGGTCYSCGASCPAERGVGPQAPAPGKPAPNTGLPRQASVILSGVGPQAPAPGTGPLPLSEGSLPCLGNDRVHRLRLRYRKVGPARLLGHLDLQRHILLALRRSGVRLAYSLGYHPRPKVSFAPALPLGHIGLNEVADVHIDRYPDPEVLLTTLQRNSIPGVEFTAATPWMPEMGDASSARFSFFVGLRSPSGVEALRGAVARGEIAGLEAFDCPAPTPPSEAQVERIPVDAIARLSFSGANVPRIEKVISGIAPEAAVVWVVRL